MKIFNICLMFAYDLDDRDTVDVYIDRRNDVEFDSQGYYNITNASISRLLSMQEHGSVHVSQFNPECKPDRLPWSRRIMVEIEFTP